MKKKVLENIVKWIFLLCGIAAVGFVLCICLYLVISGVPAIREIGLWNFLFGETWNAPVSPCTAMFIWQSCALYSTFSCP